MFDLNGDGEVDLEEFEQVTDHTQSAYRKRHVVEAAGPHVWPVLYLQ